MKASNILLITVVFFGFTGCLKEEIDFDNLSKDVAVEREIAMPLIYGSLQFEDFTELEYDSLLIWGDDTIRLYLVEDLGHSDTIQLGGLGEKMEINSLILHHAFTNSLPIGLEVQFYLYDSAQSRNLDTIILTDSPGELFILPAQVDANGLVMEELVDEQIGMYTVESSTLDYLQNNTTHLILDAIVPNTGGLVKILHYYTFEFRLGIEASGTYTTSLD